MAQPQKPTKKPFLAGPQILRIVLTAGLLATLLVVRQPCSNSVSKFVTDFGSGSASAEMPRPGTVDKPVGSDFEVINGEMTPEQLKAAIDRAHARAGAVDAGAVDAGAVDAGAVDASAVDASDASKAGASDASNAGASDSAPQDGVR